MHMRTLIDHLFGVTRLRRAKHTLSHEAFCFSRE
jgi:hypothetical protein